MSAESLPRNSEQIAAALANRLPCPACSDSISWKKKKHCVFCCGSGKKWYVESDTQDAAEPQLDACECDTCGGCGYVLDANSAPAECMQCIGFGLLAAPCEYCKGKGFVTEKHECETCGAIRSVDFVEFVADVAESNYTTHLIGRLLAAAGSNQESEVLAAEPVLRLVRGVQQVLAYDRNMKRLDELFGKFGSDHGEELIEDAAREIESVATRVRQRDEAEQRSRFLKEKAEADAENIRNAAKAANVINSLPDWVRESNPYNG
jgi:hypothetical protein